MSGHGLSSRGETSDRKLITVDSATVQQQQQQRLHSKAVHHSTSQRPDIPAYPEYKPLIQGRTLAPAPLAGGAVLGQAGNLVTQVQASAGTKVLSISSPHPGVTKLNPQVMGNTTAQELPVVGAQQATSTRALTPTNATHLAQATPVVTLSGGLASTPHAAVPTIQAITMAGNITGNTSGGGIINPIQMASLIRGSLPQSQQHVAQHVSGSHTPSAGHQIQATGTQPQIVQAYSTHVPRGAVAASALAGPKVANVATHVLRQNQPSGLQITSTSAVAPATLIPNIAGQLAPRQIIPAPNMRPASPAVSIATGPNVSSVHDNQRRAIPVNMMAQATGNPSSSVAIAATTAAAAAVQLAMTQQQSLQRPVVEVPTRPLIASRQVQHLQLGQAGGTQKLMVPAQSSVTPLLHQPQQLTGVTTGPATIVSVTTPRVTAALNLSQNQVRGQKLPAAIVPGAATVGNTVGTHQRPHKVVVCQNPTTQLHPAANMAAKLGASGAVNLTQGVARAQKAGPQHHALIPTNTITPTTLTASSLPKQAQGSNLPSSIALGNLATIASTAALGPSNNSIPVAKVPPQRQMPSGLSMAGTPEQHAYPPREGIPNSLQLRPQLTTASSVQSGVSSGQLGSFGLLGSAGNQVGSTGGHGSTTGQLGQTGSHVSGGQVISHATSIPASSAPGNQGHRGQPVIVTTISSTNMNMNVVSNSGELHPNPDSGSRAGFAPGPQIPINLAPDYIYNNLFVQPMPGQPPFSAAIRPTTIAAASSQTPNLAASLQAATQHPVATTAVSVTTPAVAAAAPNQSMRINQVNLMPIDPIRHPNILQSHFSAASAEGPRVTAEGSIHSINLTAQPVPSATHISMATPQQTSVSQPPASPARPSILRKRPNEGVTMVKKNFLGGSLRETSSPADGTMALSMPTSPKQSILDPSRENSQSSTDTASSNESTPLLTTLNPEIKLKQEPVDGVENVTNSIEASPRKKPRKQLLHANEEFQIDEGSSSDEGDMISSSKLTFNEELEKVAEEIKKEDLEEYVDEEGIRWVKDRRRHPGFNLLNYYTCSWKTRNNHFQRYSEVKPKEERRPTVNELSNIRGIHTKASGWKIYHLAAQMEELMDLEKDVCDHLSSVQENVSPRMPSNPTVEDDITMVNELAQGNLQRSQLVVDQLQEAKLGLVKVLDHQSRINDIISRHHSKRPVKKKERS